MVVFEFPDSQLAQDEQGKDAEGASLTPSPPQGESASSQAKKSNGRRLRVVLPEEPEGDGGQEAKEPASGAKEPTKGKSHTYGYMDRSAKSLKGLAAHSIIPHQASNIFH